jgi:hypothetical protein
MVNGIAFDARHGCHLNAAIFPVNHKHGVNEVIGCELVFAHEAA